MNAAIAEAARWLVSRHRREDQPAIIPSLCRQFDLSAAEAIEAIREANRLRAAPSKESLA
jgi:hypothetical protein